MEFSGAYNSITQRSSLAKFLGVMTNEHLSYLNYINLLITRIKTLMLPLQN